MGQIEFNGDIIANLAHRLGGGREKLIGGKWRTICPAHDDSDPSLGLDVGRTVPIVWCNSRGCSQADIIAGMKAKGVTAQEAGLAAWPGEGHKNKVIAFERPKRAAKPEQKPEDEWTLLASIPDDAPAYHKSADAAAIWEYRDADDRPLFYVERVNRNAGGKDFYPHTLWRNQKTGAMEWRSKAFPAPRPLYGLQHLAEKPNARILIVAGEKCADSGARCVPKRVTLSAPGGEKAVAKTDWTPINDRDVDIWPDLDSAGAAFANELKAHLLKLNPKRDVRKLRPPDDYPHKVDIADLETGAKGAPKWTAQEIANFVDTECVPQLDIVRERAPENANKPDESRFSILGHNGNVFYFKRAKNPQILDQSANTMGPNFLISLAPLGYWERRYAGKKGLDWTAAKSDLMEAAKAKGIFTADKIRGRGVHLDKGRIVVHLGDRLVVDGREVKIEDFTDTTGIYEVAQPIALDWNAPPLSTAESRKILEMAKKFPWASEQASSLKAHLLTGWTVTSQLSGILGWRSHCWLTGGTDSGKTAIINRFVKPLTPLRYDFGPGTTDAGIRQTSKQDSLPVVFDEAEAKTGAGAKRIENILMLMRGASSSSGDPTAKGTPGGHALSYKFQSAVLLASIYVPIKDEADDNRTTRLELKKPEPEVWPKLLRELDDFTPEFGAKFFRRILKLVPVLLKNIVTFQNALRGDRIGLQFGTLIAGGYLVSHDDVITPSEAKEYVESLHWGDDGQGERLKSNRDEYICLGSIVTAQVQMLVNDRSDKRLIGELVKKAFGDDGDIGVSEKDAAGVLNRHGIRVGYGTGQKGDTDEQKKTPYVWIAYRNDNLAKLISADYPWSGGGWHQLLGQIKDAEKRGFDVPKNFAGRNECWTAIPKRVFLGEDDNDEPKEKSGGQ